MGRAEHKAKHGRRPKSAVDSSPICDEDKHKLTELKSVGEKHFLAGEFDKALGVYEQALSVLPNRHEERAPLNTSRAACYIRQRKFPEAIRECSEALEVHPAFNRALMRRAQAYEQVGKLNDALRDLDPLLFPENGEAVSEEAVAMNTRIRLVMQASLRKEANGNGYPRPGSGSTIARRPDVASMQQLALAQQAQREAAAAQQREAAAAAAMPRFREKPTPPPLHFKVMFDGDLRQVGISQQATYEEIVAAVKAKHDLPLDTPAVLKYVDFQGELLTLTSRADVRMALGVALRAAERDPAMAPPPGHLPPIPVTLVKLPAGATEPTPAYDDFERRQRVMLNTQMRALSAAVTYAQKAEAAGEPKAPPEEIDIDDWLFDFAQLFRQQLSIDPDGFVEVYQQGMETLESANALEAAVRTTQAPPLLAAAAARFQEVAALALFQWGNVHTNLAAVKLPPPVPTAASVEPAEGEGAVPGEDKEQEKDTPLVTAEMVAAAEVEYALAEGRFVGALAIKPDFYEAIVALGQVYEDRAKAAGQLELHVQGATKAPPAKPHKALPAEMTRLFVAARAKFADAERALPPLPEGTLLGSNKPAPPAADAVEGAPAAQQEQVDPASMWQHVLISWGNSHYEESSLEAQLGVPGWEAKLDLAVAKYERAGISDDEMAKVQREHPGRKLQVKNAGRGKPVVASTTGKATDVAAGAKPGFDPLGPPKKSKGKK